MKATEEDYKLAKVLERLDHSQLIVPIEAGWTRCHASNKHQKVYSQIIVLCTKAKGHTGCHVDFIHMNRRPRLLPWQDYIWYD